MKKILVVFLWVLWVAQAHAQKDSSPVSSTSFRIQLLLPLYADMPGGLKGADAQWQKIAVSYYQGVLTALDTLEKAGFRLQLFVDDYKGDTNEVKRLLSRPDRQNMDLIIGPLYKNGFHIAESYSSKNKTPLLAPFLTFQAPATNEYTIAANPSIEAYGKEMARYINTLPDSVNIVLIHDNSKIDKSFSKTFLKTVDLSKHSTLKEYTYSRATHPAKVLNMNVYNWVIIPSQDEKTVNTLLYQLHDTIQDNPMSVVGMQTWLDFSNVNFKVWDTLDVHLLTPYYINYEDATITKFVKRHREKYFTEPDEYVYRGYDQLLMMVYLMRNSGTDFKGRAVEQEYQALHTIYRFNRDGRNSSLENNYLNLLRYHQFRFQKIK